MASAVGIAPLVRGSPVGLPTGLLIGLLIGSSVAVVPSAIQASPFDDKTLGGAVFTGPLHAHPTSVLGNPAALGIGGVQQYLYLGLSGRVDRFHIQRQAIVDPEAEPQTGPLVTPYTLAPGGLISGQLKASDSAVLVGAFSLPAYESFITGEDALGYHVLGGLHRRWAATLATAVRITDGLFVGASVSGTSTLLRMSFYRDTALETGRTGPGSIDDTNCGGARCGIENPQAAERWDVDVESQGIFGTQTASIRAGFAWRFRPGWWVGASYHSSPGLQGPVSLKGSVTIERAPREQSGDPTSDTVSGNAEITYRLPQTVTVGVRGMLVEGLQILAHARWQNLSRHNVLDLRAFGREVPTTIPEWYPRYRGLQDVYTFETGVEQVGIRRWLFGGRLRIERGATSTGAIAPMQVSGFNLSAVGGVELRVTRNIVLATSAGLSWFPATEVTDSHYDPREHLACIDSGYDIDTCAATAEGRGIPSAAGDYERFTLAVRSSFRVYLD